MLNWVVTISIAITITITTAPAFANVFANAFANAFASATVTAAATVRFFAQRVLSDSRARLSERAKTGVGGGVGVLEVREVCENEALCRE